MALAQLGEQSVAVLSPQDCVQVIDEDVRLALVHEAGAGANQRKCVLPRELDVL